MRIEKINDNQIRCTLNKNDLKEREIRISELAYGTAKAKALFRDMMQQASFEFGFEPDDIPLMIEAIPLPSESLVIIITKVEEPDELDTRFSNFTEMSAWEEDDEDDENDFEESEDFSPDDFMYIGSREEVLDTDKLWSTGEYPDEYLPIEPTPPETDEFISLSEALKKRFPSPKDGSQADKKKNYYHMYTFSNLDDIIDAAKLIANAFRGNSSLYKDPEENAYYLLLEFQEEESKESNMASSIMEEYRERSKGRMVKPIYFQEHFQTIIRENAINKLAQI